METTWLDDGIRVTDAAKNTVVVGTDGWSPVPEGPSLTDALSVVAEGATAERTLSGSVQSVTLPPVIVKAVSLSSDGIRQLSPNETMRFDVESYMLYANANVQLFVRFDGPATGRFVSEEGESGRYVIEFPDRTPVSIGFETLDEVVEDTVTVPETTEGVATALTALSAANTVTSPDRTWPTTRDEPPRVEFGDTTDVPATVADDRPDTGIELVVPDDLRYLFTGASLTHYLGAAVCVEPGAEPALRVGDRVVSLGELPSYQRRTAELLARCFYLDCVARGAGPHGGRLTVADVFGELGLDADRLYEASLAQRVSTYLDTEFRAVRDRFPDWHLSMYVAPTFDNVSTLPHLLQRLPHFFLPESHDLTETEWLELSSNDTFRRDPPDREPDSNGLRRVTREVSNVDLVQPELGPGREHGWLADDVPIEVFKTFPEAYENRRKYLAREGSELTVAAVLNNAEMRTEHDHAIEHYELRADELNIDITIQENISVAELARTFEATHDLVHFIGHRESAGLECADGYLSTDSLAVSNARTFFLNACGSYPEGEALIRKGSIAGGVTFESVLDSEAARVGTTFARLMVLGFSVKRGLDYARRQLLMPKDYAVVGNGTHVLAQSDALVPPMRWLFRDGEEFRIVVEHDESWAHGGYMQSRLFEEDGRSLVGRDRVYTVDWGKLREYLDTSQAPIVYEEQLWWPDELREELTRE
ncbi:MAG: hypothetical protein J07HB67_01318 [halophilic archaeon J07HB67]|jgi:hypothetical protein|nr:MAG: hypothetical protein J07HB67_01318 [halophilic archaeon J07HB67]